MARAENKVNYVPDSTVAEVAASLSWGLIKNHAFIDGNKRIGLIAAVVFLNANGYRFDVSEAEQVRMVCGRRRARSRKRSGRRGWCGAWLRCRDGWRVNPLIALGLR